MKNRTTRFRVACVAACYVATAGYAGATQADGDNSQQIDALKHEVNDLTRKIDELSRKQDAAAAAPPATIAQTPTPAPALSQDDESILHGLVKFLKGNEFYANIDLSVDDVTKGWNGIKGLPPHTYYKDGDPAAGTATPVGRTGWQPAIGTNATYFGIRGKHALGGDFNLVYQLETQVDVTSQPGTTNTNSNSSSTVKGALASRTSFLGFANKDWGSIKIGKGYGPYKVATDRLNPFSSMLGDNAVIMGNTGGDNRVEFGGYLDHAIWYESPKIHGVSFNALVSPGQNRSGEDDNIAQGESDCTGGNIPGSGALAPSCNDGSFGTAFSTSLAYEGPASLPLYVTGAYELHRSVNRVSDVVGPDPNNPASDVVANDPRDIANEWAAKIGMQYLLPTHTTLNFIWEDLHRAVPQALAFQNERSRRGTWVAITQTLGSKDDISLGWAHAQRSPGDPGQHTTPTTSNPDNQSNLFTAAIKHKLDKQTIIYANWALTENASAAHYDLGAGAHGLKTDCHDASPLYVNDTLPDGNIVQVANGPFCYPGGHIMGVSIGVNYKF